MKILEGALTSLASSGNITLQIPQTTIVFGVDGAVVEPTMEEIPDEWVCFLKNDCICVGKEHGYLYFTKVGWEANKEKIKEVYEKAINGEWNRGQTWEDFEKHVEEHFKVVEKNIKKKISKLEKDLNTLKNCVI